MTDGIETPSLDATDKSSADVQKSGTFRVTLEYMKSRIVETEFTHPNLAPHKTVCQLKLDNGWVQSGESTPADPSNYDVEKGKQFAYEDAVRRLWPLFAFAVLEYNHNESDAVVAPHGRDGFGTPLLSEQEFEDIQRGPYRSLTVG